MKAAPPPRVMVVLGPLPLRGGLIIPLRGSAPRIATKAALAYHAIVCGISRVMVTDIICKDQGTYMHLDPKSNKVKNDKTGSCLGLKFQLPTIEQGNPINSRQGLETHPTTIEKGFSLQRPDTQQHGYHEKALWPSG